MKTKKVKITYLLELSLDTTTTLQKQLALKEIDNVIQTICQAAYGIQGIKSSCRKVKNVASRY